MIPTNQKAVFGLGFGDEGKGHVVDWLCSKHENPLVVRFSGGHQAGHHVVMEDGREHVFAHFGSGALRGAPTYWIGHCIANPVSLMVEFSVLEDKGVKPMLFVESTTPLTTPYDIQANRLNSETSRHGTCGVGIFETVKRTREKVSLLFEDIFFPTILEHKLNLVREYYSTKVAQWERDFFFDACRLIRRSKNIFMTHGEAPDARTKGIGESDAFIFEGSQGLLLDHDFGFFPHVTPSNTGSHTLRELGFAPEVVLVTRAYQTRHGAGPMSRTVSNSILENPWERNGAGGAQGEFRKTLLDLEFLRYAVAKDDYIRESKKTLVVTCMDLMENEERLLDGDKVIQCEYESEFLSRICDAVGAERVFVSRGPTAEDIKEAP